MNNTKQILKNQVSDFKKWWSKNYTEEEIIELNTDDVSFPKWDEIETNFENLVKNNSIQDLDKEDQINLLWLIARNWDIGSMIGWLSKTNTLSNLGFLNESDFISLAKTLIEQDLKEFDDAKSQFASSFKKLPKLTTEIEHLILKYFNDKNEYTRRLSLYSLSKLGYPEIMDLIEKSWDKIDVEEYKMGCLYVIDLYIKDDEIMKKYLNKALNCEGEYLQKQIIELKQKYTLSN